MSKHFETKFRRYDFIFYVFAMSFRQNLIFFAACVKKTNKMSREKAYFSKQCLLLHRPQKISVFRKTTTWIHRILWSTWKHFYNFLDILRKNCILNIGCMCTRNKTPPSTNSVLSSHLSFVRVTDESIILWNFMHAWYTSICTCISY